ncbi:MAG: phenazine biosynthesis protein [Bacteriophage sp.]|nr:MAG: phenazine biosynthesis protein [Bacteriophage sp.]
MKKKSGNTNHKKRNHGQHSRYLVICKVGNNVDGSAKCVKHRCKDLLKLVQFYNTSFPDWRWFNVFSNDGPDKGQQLASFTKNRLPTRSSV